VLSIIFIQLQVFLPVVLLLSLTSITFLVVVSLCILVSTHRLFIVDVPYIDHVSRIIIRLVVLLVLY
jgi:hypothetical protein